MVQVLLAIEDRIPGVSVNFPPEWLSVPSPPVFFEGTPGETYSLLPYAFDPDGDTLIFSDSGGGFTDLAFDDTDFDPNAFDFSEGLPEGVSIVGSDLIIDALAPAANVNVEVYVSDGINTPVLSGTFNITITSLDIAPTIDTTPNPTFLGGVADTYDFNDDITDDAVSPLTFSLSGTLGSGLSLNSSTGILTYNGSGVSNNSHTLTVSDAVGQATSNSFVINTTLSDTPDYDDPVAGVVILGGRTVTNVSTNTELTNALAAASPGETIQCATGTYTSAFTMDTVSPSNNPVILKGASNFTTIFTGKLTMLGEKNIATGIFFNGTGATAQIRGINNKLIANKFTGRKGNMVTPGNGNDPDPGDHCEIAYNEFYEPGDWDNSYPPTEFRMAVRMTTGNSGKGPPDTSLNSVHLEGWLHHNYVHDFPNKPVPTDYHSGQSDSFELGESAYDWNQSPIGWYVEDNIIQRHLQSGQSSVIDIKSAGVVCRRNTALDSQNIRVDNRLGGQCIIESNWCGSIHVHSKDNIVVGNRVDTIIATTAGDVLFDALQEPGKTHQQCVDTLITGNIGNIDDGRYFGQGDQTFPALNTTIEAHTGNVKFTGSQGAIDNRNVFPSSRNFVPAVQGSVSDVGPNALDNASDAYKAARGFAEETLLTEDFSDANWYTKWHDSSKVYAGQSGNYTSEPARMNVVTPGYSSHSYSAPPSNNNAVEVTIKANTNLGIGNWSFFPREASYGQNPTEMYLEYWIRLGDTWNNRYDTAGKFPGISGDFNDGAKGNAFDSAGMNGWSARSEWFGICASPNHLDTAFGTYTYAVEDSDFSPAVTPANDPGRGFIWDTMGCGESNAMVINTWYKIKLYCKANVGENRNGIVRGWLNDVQQGEHASVMWTKNPAYQAIDRAWMNVYHGGGGSAVPPVDLHVYIADVQIWVP